MTLVVPEPLRAAVDARLAAWRAMNGTRRLWSRDASLWTGAGEDRWLGWLDIVAAEQAALPQLEDLARAVRAEGFRHILVIGMGGSSLCPAVLSEVVGSGADDPKLHVLDSTDPSQIRTMEAALDLDRTLFVVSSKSGSTLEPKILRDYFLHRVRERAGDRAGRQFVAITDPGSKLEAEAGNDGFRTVLYGVPEIGGRFSALSHFGMAPALMADLPVKDFLRGAEDMVAACRNDDPAKNPGVMLGVVMAEAERLGKDKLTIIAGEDLAPLGMWLEQLIAESTGKHGRAVIPLSREEPGPPGCYGTDRLFVRLRVAGFPEDELDASMVALVQAGHPLVEIAVRDALAIGAEFFRWEIATAVCGAVMGINPFDQPDVEAAKVETRRLTDAVTASGSLPAEDPFLSHGGLRFFADPSNMAAVLNRPGPASSAECLRAHLARLKDGDYFAMLAFLELDQRHSLALERIRHLVRDRKRVATTLGFGPRYLHSTGQAHKGGPDNGVFLLITCDEPRDLPVPSCRYSFGTVKAAQARGDFAVLAARGRRALRVHLGSDVAAGLAELDAAVRAALS